MVYYQDYVVYVFMSDTWHLINSDRKIFKVIGDCVFKCAIRNNTDKNKDGIQ